MTNDTMALIEQIQKSTDGDFLRTIAEKALTAVIQEAWIQGVSTRKVDDLVQALGMTGISKSQVSALCQEIDERVQSFLERPLDGEWPYVWLDATYLKVRQNGRIPRSSRRTSIAAIIATGVHQDGRREILGLGLGPSEAATPAFAGAGSSGSSSCAPSGAAAGVRLVISDAHEGLKGKRCLTTPPSPSCHRQRQPDRQRS